LLDGGYPKSLTAIGYPFLAESLRNSQPDVLIDAAPTFQFLSSMRRRAARSLFPIITIHHTLSHSYQLYWLFLPFLLADSYSCDSFVCTSRAAERAFLNILGTTRQRFQVRYGIDLEYRGRTDIIPLGVDTDRFRPRDKRDTRANLGLPRDAVIILYFGRLSVIDKADLFPLLRVFKELVSRYSTMNLFMVLAGSDYLGYSRALGQAACALGIERRVRVETGYTEHPELWYSAADIFVSPVDNVQESFGLSVIEAMASGVPQVVSDWDGYRETVAHGETGFLVPTRWASCDGLANDAASMPVRYAPDLEHLVLAQSVVVEPAKFLEYMGCLIANPEMRAAFGDRSRQRAQDLFAWPKVVGRYDALMSELTSDVRATRFIDHSDDDFLVPSYFQWFSHYATESVSSETFVGLTKSGAEASGSNAVSMFLGHPAIRWDVVQEGLCVAILGLCERGPLPVRELVQRLGGWASGEEIRRHVLWLVKQQLLEFLPSNTAWYA